MPLLVLGLLVGGLAIAAIAGRDGGGAGAGGRDTAGAVATRLATGAATAPVAPSGVASSGVVPPGGAAPGRPLAAPLVTSPPGQPVELSAIRNAAAVFVHGDVFVADVTWVFVSLQDGGGEVAGWASVSVPGAAGEPRGSGPSLRFDVELAIPPAQQGRELTVHANAYDASGAAVAATSLALDGSQAGG